MTPVVAAVRELLSRTGTEPLDILEIRAERLITAVLDNLDREAMVIIVADFMAASTRAMREHMARQVIDAALAAVRPCPADATLATKENGDGND